MDTFRVNEHFNGFELEHIHTGRKHWLSDGVDALFDDADKAINPGTTGFCEKWAAFFNENESQTLEAYFPELAD